MSSPSLYSGMLPTASITHLNSSSVSSSPKSSIRKQMAVRRDTAQGRIVEFPDPAKIQPDIRLPKERDPNPWKQFASSSSTFFGLRIEKSRNLESIHLRGSKQLNRSSLNNAQSSSSKRSDSITNDSALTTESQDRLTNASADKLVKESTTTESADSPTSQDFGSFSLEDQEMHRTIEKCRNWVENLPAKFSSHVDPSPTVNELII
ncbi:hypothetical protein Btru_076143 [Bulinus truncatus]|nr:hypothetical protein Btru_076143 [Bulinus truncatus]